MVSVWQILAWMLCGLVVVGGGIFLVSGFGHLRGVPGLAPLGAVGLFGGVIVALQVRILARLSRIEAPGKA